jgi:hypothetical protein
LEFCKEPNEAKPVENTVDMQQEQPHDLSQGSGYEKDVPGSFQATPMNIEDVSISSDLCPEFEEGRTKDIVVFRKNGHHYSGIYIGFPIGECTAEQKEGIFDQGNLCVSQREQFAVPSSSVYIKGSTENTQHSESVLLQTCLGHFLLAEKQFDRLAPKFNMSQQWAPSWFIKLNDVACMKWLVSFGGIYKCLVSICATSRYVGLSESCKKGGNGYRKNADLGRRIVHEHVVMTKDDVLDGTKEKVPWLITWTVNISEANKSPLQEYTMMEQTQHTPDRVNFKLSLVYNYDRKGRNEQADYDLAVGYMKEISFQQSLSDEWANFEARDKGSEDKILLTNFHTDADYIWTSIVLMKFLASHHAPEKEHLSPPPTLPQTKLSAAVARDSQNGHESVGDAQYKFKL